MVEFKDLIPDESLLAAVNALGFTEPTDIQVQVIPLALKGRDLIGQAKTGSGKTLAFGIPLLKRLSPEHRPQALIIVPTRELCQQVVAEISKIARHNKILAVFGGVSIRPQIKGLRSAQIVVGTPGRLLDHLERGTFRTEAIRFLVFDEADRMFDMGFLKPMERIMEYLPKERQTLLFSATMPDPIKRLASKYQHDPVHVKTHSHIESHLLPQEFYWTTTYGKFSLLVHLLKTEDPNLAIIFCRTKYGSKRLARNLHRLGFEADAMHGNLSQAQRDQVLADFKKGKVRFLVATDVAGRGLDVDSITHIFNYNIPNVPEDYIHRIGRTARAGASGKAITFVESGSRSQWARILRMPGVHAHERKVENVVHVEFHRSVRSSGRPAQRLGRPSGRLGGRPGGRPGGARQRPRPARRPGTPRKEGGARQGQRRGRPGARPAGRSRSRGDQREGQRGSQRGGPRRGPRKFPRRGRNSPRSRNKKPGRSRR